MTAIESRRIRIVLVEDHKITRLGLRTLIEGCKQFTVVGEAGTVAQAIAAVDELKPDVLLLDVRLPDGEGFTVCRHIQQQGLATRILVLTSFADEPTLFAAIAAGADGYLLKEVDTEALVTAIENVASGKSILDPSVTRRVISRVKSGQPPEENKLDMLSPQEHRVLARVAEGKTNKQIGEQMGLSDKTVKNYLSNAMEKLDFSRRSQAAAFFATHCRMTDGRA